MRKSFNHNDVQIKRDYKIWHQKKMIIEQMRLHLWNSFGCAFFYWWELVNIQKRHVFTKITGRNALSPSHSLAFLTPIALSLNLVWFLYSKRQKLSRGGLCVRWLSIQSTYKEFISDEVFGSYDIWGLRGIGDNARLHGRLVPGELREVVLQLVLARLHLLRQ